AIDAKLHAVGFQKLGEPGGRLRAGRGRVVHHRNRRLQPRLDGRLQRQAQALHFSPVHFFVVRTKTLGPRQKPASRPANGELTQRVVVVLKRVHPWGQRLPHFADGAPPVVVVSPDEDHFSRQRSQ